MKKTKTSNKNKKTELVVEKITNKENLDLIGINEELENKTESEIDDQKKTEENVSLNKPENEIIIPKQTPEKKYKTIGMLSKVELDRYKKTGILPELK